MCQELDRVICFSPNKYFKAKKPPREKSRGGSHSDSALCQI